MAIQSDHTHKILREIYKHYTDYRDFVSRTGKDVIQVHRPDGEGNMRQVTISFSDLKHGVEDLAPRKKQAFFLNVILDKKQKDVAEIMGITTVSVGQYVDAAMQQLAKRYFADDEEVNKKFNK